MRALGAIALVAACSSPAQPPVHRGGAGSAAPMLAALPKPEAVATAAFVSVAPCARCHGPAEKAMRDAQGRDISPVTDSAATVMALSARDPYYLAAFRRELLANPGAAAQITATCIRCHAPVGFAEDARLTLDDLERGTSDAAVLGREGAGCAGCHAQPPEGLGTEATFTGRAALRTDRVAFGALPRPEAEAMVTMVRTTPMRADHVSESRLCAGCHTVLVHALDGTGAPAGDEVPEQATYLEWRNSDFQDETRPAGPRAQTCQGCHQPVEQGLVTPFSTRPVDAPTRSGYERHTLYGGNAYLLDRLAAKTAWLNAAATPEQLRDAARGTRTNLAKAARLALQRTGNTLRVTVENATGHKLPSGYPTRRMWLHVAARAANGRVVFETGAVDRRGALVDMTGRRLDGPGAILPHVDEIARGDQVAVWEAVPVDATGARTHLLLGTARFAKDNRILPAGWSDKHPDAPRTRPIGVAGDATFVAGKDTVTVKLPDGAAEVLVELLYQPIPPETIESYKATDSPEAARFLDVFDAPPPAEVLARETLPPPGAR
ncbi:MAG: hypothetical protein KF773_28595 [Deltaproteobacteria bacterium]|nr:hypothetical protein [Deltaproteobacteria bacterium]